MKIPQSLNHPQENVLVILIMLFVWLLTFHLFLAFAHQLLSNTFYHETNLRSLADALLLRDGEDLSSLRLFIVFPMLPIYGLTLLSYFPLITPIFLPMWISVIMVSTGLTLFLWRLWKRQTSGIWLIVLWATMVSHPVILSTAIAGYPFIWAACVSLITTQSLYSLSAKFHTVPLVHISLALTVAFMVDINYFAVVIAMLIMMTVCLNHRHYQYDYGSLWATFIFPLLLFMVVVLVAAFFQGHPMEGIIHGLPDFGSLTTIGFVEIKKRLTHMLDTIVLGFAVFPILIWQILVLRSHKTLVLPSIMASLYPGLITFFTVDQPLEVASPLVYYLGPVVVGIYHSIHYARSHHHPSALAILMGAGSLLLWSMSSFDSKIMEPIEVLLGHQVRPDFHEDIRLGRQFTSLLPAMVDGQSSYPIIATLGSARHLILPKTPLFKIDEERKEFSSPFILIPQPDHPNYSKDRVAKIYIDIYQKANFNYHQVYKSKRWLVLQRND